MRYVLSESHDPFFNLAAEEYLLKYTHDNIFMLWRSEPSVIVGKHQNALAEINYKTLIDKNITLARRLSGGGTVVHDLQNLNFTFIANGEEGKLIDFKKFISPVLAYLQSLGLDAWIGEKNDIRIGRLKISGNAEHIYKKRVLHHGTLLFNSDLDQLRQAIDVVPGKYFDKAVQSNRSSVVNIIDLLKSKMTIQDFIHGLSVFVLHKEQLLHKSDFTPEEKTKITQIAEEKYKTIDWILGYSPKYTFKNSFKYQGKNWVVEFNVEKGRIKQAIVVVDGTQYQAINEGFLGRMHKKKEIAEVISLFAPVLNLSVSDELVFNFF